MNKLNSVLIVAGTDGNELSGIYLHKLIKEKLLIVDLHNTTSNTGATLILLSNDVFYQKLGAYVKVDETDTYHSIGLRSLETRLTNRKEGANDSSLNQIIRSCFNYSRSLRRMMRFHNHRFER